MSTPAEDLLVNTEGSARALSVSPSSIRAYAEAGTIRIYKIGKAHYYPASDLVQISHLTMDDIRRQLKVSETVVRAEGKKPYVLARQTRREADKTRDFIDASWRREQGQLMRELDSRIMALERVAGMGARGQGMTISMLTALADESVRRSLRVDTMEVEELRKWVRRVHAIDYQTVAACFSRPELASLPQWLLRMGLRIVKLLPTHEEQVEAITYCRNLRLLLVGFNPPRPVFYRAYDLPTGMNAVEALIVASHAANSL